MWVVSRKVVESHSMYSVGGRGEARKFSAATSKASFNRFSVFVKSGSENFILGKINIHVPEPDILTVVVS